MNTSATKSRLRPSQILDGTLIALDLAAIAYSVVAIVIGFSSEATYAAIATVIGVIGLVVFLPGLVLLGLGIRQRRYDRSGDTLVLVGRVAIAVPLALAAQLMLPNLLTTFR